MTDYQLRADDDLLTPVGFALETGQLEKMEASHHEDLHVVSNLLGGEGMRFELRSPLRLAPRDGSRVAASRCD